MLRELRREGVHVRRQHPVGRYVADFAVLKQRTAIEIDGPLHERQIEQDRERDAYFAQLDWRVLRYTSKQVEDGAGFMASVRAALIPSPRGEGEGGGAMLDGGGSPHPLAPSSQEEGEFASSLQRRTRANRRFPSRAKR